MPNLLFILSDQHCRSVAGCYGDETGVTPNLDRLAAGGVRFRNAYCPSPICLPSRMSLLTARQPHRHGSWTNTDFLPSDMPTFAHALGAAGYQPRLVGRMHALGPDQLHGFVDRPIGDHSPNWIGIPRHDLGALANANDPYRVSLQQSGAGQSAYEVKDEAVTRCALDSLRSYGERRRQGDTRPFALTVGYMLPHPPYVARAADYERFEGRVPPPRLAPPAAGEEHPWIEWWRHDRGLDETTEEETRRARTAYYALTSRLDAMIGELLNTLEAEGLAEDTLVVYSSDHGDNVGERGLWWKHTFHEESVAVPLILRWPGQLPEGETRDAVVNLTDVAATMLDAMGAPALPAADGRSFLDVARHADAPWLDETFAEYCTDDTPAWTGGKAVRQRMIRRGRYKLVYYHGFEPQLFDLGEDPDETRDLAGLPEWATVREQLLERLLADWDPVAIDERMRARTAEKQLIGAWAQATRPESTHMWTMDPADNFLDAPGRRAAE
jgi:choline-sulfatase